MFRFFASRVFRFQGHNSPWSFTMKDDLSKTPGGVLQLQTTDDVKTKYRCDSHEHSDEQRTHNYSWSLPHYQLPALPPVGLSVAFLLSVKNGTENQHIERLNNPQCNSLFYYILSKFSFHPHAISNQPAWATVQNFASEVDRLVDEFTRTYENYRGTLENRLGLERLSCNDYTNAVIHWKRASKDGNPKAQYNLGLAYHRGIGVEKNVTTAIDFYKMACRKQHPYALYNLAVIYMEDGDETKYKEGLLMMKMAARLEVEQAQLYMGLYYVQDEHRDLTEAVRMFSKAAEQKNPDAQYYLGLCYENGRGVDKNECKAVYYYTMASRSGHADATYNLAVCHQNAVGGLPQNIAAAKELYSSAVALGCDEAREILNNIKELEESSPLAEVTAYPASRTTMSSHHSSPVLISGDQNHLTPHSFVSPSSHNVKVTFSLDSSDAEHYSENLDMKRLYRRYSAETGLSRTRSFDWLFTDSRVINRCNT